MGWLRRYRMANMAEFPMVGKKKQIKKLYNKLRGFWAPDREARTGITHGNTKVNAYHKRKEAENG